MKNIKIPVRHISFLLTLFILGLLTTSCYKDYGMSIEDYDLVAAFYDKDTDFSMLTSYAMPDTVLHIVGEDDEDDIDRTFDKQVLEQIDLNLQTLGYKKLTLEDIATGDTPDVVMLVAVNSAENTVWYPGYPGYPGWGYWPGWGYYPGYGPGWGWYYPPYWSASSYTTGSLILTMIDPENSNIDAKELKIVWAAGVNGLLDDNDANIRKRLTYSISEAFRISPYLGVVEN